MANERSALLPSKSSRTTNQRATSLRRSRTSAVVLGIIVLFVSTAAFLRWRRAVVPDYIDHDFGVGFDLTYPYGTAAISYPNGTIINVVKLDASSPYKEMMERLSLESSRHPHPPYRELDEAFLDYPRQCLRQARKAAGLPASSDVSKLAHLILALRSEIEKYLGRKVAGGTVAITPFPALYEEDLADAFDYAGLIYVPQWPYWRGGLFLETHAVYLANGFGTCSNYTDIVSCDQELRHPPHQPLHENVLSVSYTRDMLATTWSQVGMGFGFPHIANPVVVDWNLGWDKRHNNPNEDYYWAGVRDAIIKPVLEANRWIRRNTSKVLLFGECVRNDRFQKVLRQAVDDVLSSDVDIFAHYPVYAGARGAAEMAKRQWWRYNHTGPL